MIGVVDMKEKFYRFMQGRYGVDQFSKFLTLVGIILFVLSKLMGGFIFYFIGLALILYAYFRMFSKNIAKRYGENQKYLFYKDKVKFFFNKEKSKIQGRKTHRIFKCPSCKQKVRVPKGKGKIEITCPKCRTKFIKRS